MPTNPRPSNDPPPLADDDRQRLVAYLDGELSAEECRNLESELAGNDAVRTEMQRLDRVWNALDALPRATVDESFTKSTVEMVAAEAKEQVEQLTAALPVQRRRRGYRAAAVCLAALFAGLIVTRGLATRNDRRVLLTLPVLYQIDALGQFRDPDFLRQLRQRSPGLIAEFEGGEYQGVPVSERAASWLQIAESSLLERADWVAAQPDEEKLRLQRASKRFEGNSESSRESAGRLLEALTAQEDADQLFATAMAYQAWLATQTPSTQSRLRQIDDPAARIAEVNKLYRADRYKAQRTLSNEDAAALREAIKDLATTPEIVKVREGIASRLRRNVTAFAGDRPDGGLGRRPFPELREFEQRAKTFPAGPIMVLADLAGSQSDRFTQFLRVVLRERFDQVAEQARDVWPEIEARLTRDLSPKAKSQLASMSALARIGRLRAWVREAALAKPDAAEIEAYFASNSLSDQERHELLALPTEEMKRRLYKSYIEEQFGSTAPEGAGGAPGGGRGERWRREGKGPPGDPRGGPPRGQRRFNGE